MHRCEPGKLGSPSKVLQKISVISQCATSQFLMPLFVYSSELIYSNSNSDRFPFNWKSKQNLEVNFIFVIPSLVRKTSSWIKIFFKIIISLQINVLTTCFYLLIFFYTLKSHGVNLFPIFFFLHLHKIIHYQLSFSQKKNKNFCNLSHSSSYNGCISIIEFGVLRSRGLL